jgi:radical SAM enzyme (TIGR01210 family)
MDFGDINDYTNEMQSIREWALRLRQIRPPIKTSWEEPADWVTKGSNLGGKTATVVSITLTPTGCEWANSGGCTMCGEYEGSAKNVTVSPEFHIAQFASAVSKYVALHHPSWLRIYQEGNYTNAHEVHPTAQKTILRLASMISGVQRITIESMAKYISQEGAQNLRSTLASNAELEVGMGFEAENDVVRNVCVNKGETMDDYRRAIKLLRSQGLHTLAYVLLKPPFLSESEAIDEAIRTIRIANDLGFDAVSLEPMSVHRFSLVHALYLEGLYRPPWLWSVIEVAKNVHIDKEFRIGGVGYYPRSVDVAHNKCQRQLDCNKKCWNAIREYNQTRDFGALNDLSCECRRDWETELQRIEPPLKERINVQVARLNYEKYVDSVKSPESGRNLVLEHALPKIGGTQYEQNTT